MMKATFKIMMTIVLLIGFTALAKTDVGNETRKPSQQDDETPRFEKVLQPGLTAKLVTDHHTSTDLLQIVNNEGEVLCSYTANLENWESLAEEDPVELLSVSSLANPLVATHWGLGNGERVIIMDPLHAVSKTDCLLAQASATATVSVIADKDKIVFLQTSTDTDANNHRISKKITWKPDGSIPKSIRWKSAANTPKNPIKPVPEIPTIPADTTQLLVVPEPQTPSEK